MDSTNITEGQLSITQLTFTPENWNVAQAITLTGQADYLSDGDTAYEIVFTPSVSEDVLYHNLTLDTLSVINTDDYTNYAPMISTSVITVTEGQVASFGVKLNSAPTEDVNIAFSPTDTTAVVLSSQSLTFTSENWNEYQTVSVTGVEKPDNANLLEITFLPTESEDRNFSDIISQSIAISVEDAPAVVEDAPVVVEDSPVVVEDAPAAIEDTPAVVEVVPVKKGSGGTFNISILLFLILISGVKAIRNRK